MKTVPAKKSKVGKPGRPTKGRSHNKIPQTLKERLGICQKLFGRTGCCYGIKRLQLKEQDPIHYEIFHARLLSSAIAARQMAKQITSSVMTREEGELSFALFTPEGYSVVFSTGLMAHISVMGKFIRWMIENDYEENPGFNEGDHFCCNDTTIAGIHVADVYFATPVYYDGKIVAWVAGITHVLEVGGIVPGGGISPFVVERPMEGLHISAEKVAVGDQLKKEYEIRIRKNTRNPSFWLLDDRARLAGNAFIREETKNIIKDFGLGYFEKAVQELIEEGRRHSRARFREKLIPGRYREAGFFDALLAGKPGILLQAQKDSALHYPLELVIKPDGTMALNCEGTSPWGFHNLNCMPSSLEGGLSSTLAQILHFDGKANDGCMSEVTLILPWGSAVNPDYSFAATGLSWAAIITLCNMLLKAFSRGFYARGFLEEILAGGTISTGMEFGGRNQYGQLTGGANAEATATASGARGVWDGIDAAWAIWNPEGDQGNVEFWELLYPILYLGRRALRDSGGPGKYRGGCVFESTYMIHNSNFVTAHSIPTTTKFAHNLGLFGGYGGGVSKATISPKNNMKELIESQSPLPHGEGEDPGNPEIRNLLKGDVRLGCDGYYIVEPLQEGAIYEKNWLPGGGGLGDPLERAISLVEKDLNALLVTPKAAESIYGVKVRFDQTSKEWIADPDGSKVLRSELRQERLKRARPVEVWWRTERARILKKEYAGPIKEMYNRCLDLSPQWSQEFHSLWDLPEGFRF